MSEDLDKNYLQPYIKFSWKIVESVASGLGKSYDIWDGCWKGKNAGLICCGCCWFIVPILTAQSLIIFGILAALSAFFAVIGLAIGAVYSLIGTWPAFIITFGITGTTIIRVPSSFYYTFKVLYNSACITRSLKVLIAVLSIPTIILTPIFVLISAFIISFVVCFVTSFCGWVIKPWTNIGPALKKFWKVYVEDAEAFAEDYGHPTGIPNNWDGRVYGGYFNPLTITLGAILFVYGLVTMTVGTTHVIVLKIIPIYIFAIIKTWKNYNPVKAAKIYKDVLICWLKGGTVKHYCDCIKAYWKLSPANMIPDECCLILVLSWLIILSFLTWMIVWPIVIVGPILTYLMGIVLILIGCPLIYIFIWLFALVFPIMACITFICVSPFFSVRCPNVALRHNIMLPGQLKRSLRLGLYEPVNFMKYLDRQTSKLSFKNYSVFMQENVQDLDDFTTSWEYPISIWKQDTDRIKKIHYWDLAFEALKKVKDEVVMLNWIPKEDVESAMPNVLMTLPALTIIEVLVESIRKDINNESLVYWNDDNQCDDKTRDRKDNIISHYFPLIIDIKKDLLRMHDANTSKEETKEEGIPLVTQSSNTEGAKTDANSSKEDTKEEGIPLVTQSSNAEDAKTDDKEISSHPAVNVQGEKEKRGCWSFFCKGKKVRPPPEKSVLDKEIWYMKAKICSGDSEQTTELQEAVKKYSFEESKLTELNRTCAKTNNVVLSLLRVQEMTTRMNTILN